MGEVIVLPEVNEKLNELVFILYKKGYFGFLESAIDYVNNIYDFIETIPEQRQYKTKRKKHGQFYCRYRASKHTTYYVTFDRSGDTYMVRNIISNHTREYAAYIMGV